MAPLKAGLKQRAHTEFIVIHSSATSAKTDIGIRELRRRDMRRFWTDVIYHVAIRRDGSLETGREIDTVGASLDPDLNEVSIGICLIGGANDRGNPQDNFTPAQAASLKTLLIELQARYPTAQIVGHRDLPTEHPCDCHKACPGFSVAVWRTNHQLPGDNQ